MQAIRLIATHTAKPGQREALLAALKKNVLGSRKEAGNITFEVFEDTTTAGVFHLIEDWRSMEAIEAHREAPHFKEYMAQAENFLAERVATYTTHIPFTEDE